MFLKETHNHLKFPILESPPAKPRFSCLNNFFVHKSSKKDDILPRQIAWAKASDRSVRDRFGTVWTLVFVKQRKELDQLRAQGIVRGDCAWDDFQQSVSGGREALNGAIARVIGHVGAEDFTKLIKLFVINKQVKSSS